VKQAERIEPQPHGEAAALERSVPLPRPRPAMANAADDVKSQSKKVRSQLR
jgi:hypothetical protein